MKVTIGTILWPSVLSPAWGNERIRWIARNKERGQWEGLPETTYIYFSTDDGRSWPEKVKLQEWGFESNILPMRSGRLLATIRYQRFRGGILPPGNEPPEITRMAAEPGYKVAVPVGKQVFFADSMTMTGAGRISVLFFGKEPVELT